MRALNVIVSLGVCVAIYFGIEWYSNESAKKSAIEQYEFVKRNGSAMDACAYAAMVTSVHLHVGDEFGYRKWLVVEKEECQGR